MFTIRGVLLSSSSFFCILDISLNGPEKIILFHVSIRKHSKSYGKKNYYLQELCINRWLELYALVASSV